jgi:hypothetical protein
MAYGRGWLLSPRTVEWAWATSRSPNFPPELWSLFIGLALCVPFVFAGSALALRRRIIGELDHWLDRRPVSPMPAPDPIPARDPEEVATR